MGSEISRRRFLKKTAIGLGNVALCDFKGIGSAEQVSGSKTLLGEKLRERMDPHVIPKLYPGRSEQQKVRLAEAIGKDVVVLAPIFHQALEGCNIFRCHTSGNAVLL